jgi:DNA primase
MVDSVENLLMKRGIRYKIQGSRELLIQCLNPDHNDHNPSMSINKYNGLFNCFSCGFKGSLYKLFDIELPVENIRINELMEKLITLKVKNGIDIPLDAVPFNRLFRNISASTLLRFEAFTSNTYPDRVAFPIRGYNDGVQAIITRHMFSDENPKYLIYPDKAKIETYPLVINPNVKYIVLVEGIFDMLTLYDAGVENVICTFGTGFATRKDIKELLEPYLLTANKIYIMYDGDKAGTDAAKKLDFFITKHIQTATSEVITMDDGVDPNTMTKSDIDSLNKYLRENK